MSTRGGESNGRLWQRRRDAWFAEHPVCACGSSDRLKLVWNGEGPKPFRSMLEVFRAAVGRQPPILAQCIPQCYTCWVATRRRNEHGGGKTGIAKCKCDLCRQRRAAFSREWGLQQTALWQERRDRFREKGVPIPVRRASKDNNTWNRSEKGITYKKNRRSRLRDTWLEGRRCVSCGGTNRLAATWIEWPGPFVSTGQIWTYGAAKRAELLEKCHTLCVSCLRTTGNQRNKEKK